MNVWKISWSKLKGIFRQPARGISDDIEGISTFRRRHALFFKTTAMFLILAFLSADIVRAQGAAPLWQNTKADMPVRTPEVHGIEVPYEQGKPVDAYSNGGDEIIINIQDAHASLSAQYSIIDLLQSLYAKYDLDVIALEGAEGPLDLSLLRSFPDADVRRRTSEGLMREGLMSAGELFSIISEDSLHVYGIESDDLYQANIKALNDIMDTQSESLSNTMALQRALNVLKERIFSDDLMTLTEHAYKHREGDVTFAEHWDVVSDIALRHGITITPADGLSDLLTTIELEKEIDFNRANRERNIVIDVLSRMLEKDALEELVQISVRFKTGRVSQGEFHRYLAAQAETAGLDPEEYGNLISFTRYVTIYEDMDILEIFGFMDDIERTVREKLFRNDEERELYHIDRALRIIEKLYTISLTTDDRRYMSEYGEYFTREKIKEFIREKCHKYALKPDEKYDLDAIYGNLHKGYEFYELAEKRNAAMIQKTVKAMRQNGKKAAALITGGFHSDGLKGLIKGNGLSYLVILPKFENDKDRPYITVLTNRKQPYEELIAKGEYSLAVPLYSTGPDKTRIVDKVLMDIAAGVGNQLFAGKALADIEQKMPDLRREMYQRAREELGSLENRSKGWEKRPEGTVEDVSHVLGIRSPADGSPADIDDKVEFSVKPIRPRGRLVVKVTRRDGDGERSVYVERLKDGEVNVIRADDTLPEEIAEAEKVEDRRRGRRIDAPGVDDKAGLTRRDLLKGILAAAAAQILPGANMSKADDRRYLITKGTEIQKDTLDVFSRPGDVKRYVLYRKIDPVSREEAGIILTRESVKHPMEYKYVKIAGDEVVLDINYDVFDAWASMRNVAPAPHSMVPYETISEEVKKSILTPLKQKYPEEMANISNVSDDEWVDIFVDLCEVHRLTPPMAKAHIEGVGKWLAVIIKKLEQLNAGVEMVPEILFMPIYDIRPYDQTYRVKQGFPDLLTLLSLADYMQSLETDISFHKKTGRDVSNDYLVPILRIGVESHRRYPGKIDMDAVQTEQEIARIRKQIANRRIFQAWHMARIHYAEGVHYDAKKPMMESAIRHARAEERIGALSVGADPWFIKYFRPKFRGAFDRERFEESAAFSRYYSHMVAQRMSPEGYRAMEKTRSELGKLLNEEFGDYNELSLEELVAVPEAPDSGFFKAVYDLFSFPEMYKGSASEPLILTMKRMTELDRLFKAFKSIIEHHRVRGTHLGDVSVSEMQRIMDSTVHNADWRAFFKKVTAGQKKRFKSPDIFKILFFVNTRQTGPVLIEEGPDKGKYGNTYYRADYKTVEHTEILVLDARERALYKEEYSPQGKLRLKVRSLYFDKASEVEVKGAKDGEIHKISIPEGAERHSIERYYQTKAEPVGTEVVIVDKSSNLIYKRTKTGDTVTVHRKFTRAGEKYPTMRMERYRSGALSEWAEYQVRGKRWFMTGHENLESNEKASFEISEIPSKEGVNNLVLEGQRKDAQGRLHRHRTVFRGTDDFFDTPAEVLEDKQITTQAILGHEYKTTRETKLNRDRELPRKVLDRLEKMSEREDFTAILPRRFICREMSERSEKDGEVVSKKSEIIVLYPDEKVFYKQSIDESGPFARTEIMARNARNNAILQQVFEGDTFVEENTQLVIDENTPDEKWIQLETRSFGVYADPRERPRRYTHLEHFGSIYLQDGLVRRYHDNKEVPLIGSFFKNMDKDEHRDPEFKATEDLKGISIPRGSFCGVTLHYDPRDQRTVVAREYRVTDPQGNLIFSNTVNEYSSIQFVYDPRDNTVRQTVFINGHLIKDESYYDRDLWILLESKIFKPREDGSGGTYLYEHHTADEITPESPEDVRMYEQLDGTRSEILAGRHSKVKRYDGKGRVATSQIIYSSEMKEDISRAGVWGNFEMIENGERLKQTYRSIPIMDGQDHGPFVIENVGTFTIKGRFLSILRPGETEATVIEADNNSKFSIERQWKEGEGGRKTDSRVTIAVDDPFGKLLYKEGPVDGLYSIRSLNRKDMTVEHRLSKRGDPEMAPEITRVYFLNRVNSPDVPDEWYLIREETSKNITEFTYDAVYVNGRPVGYHQMIEKVVRTREDDGQGKIISRTVYTYEEPAGNIVRVGTHSHILKPGTIKVIAVEKEMATGNTNTYTSYLFPISELEKHRLIAEMFYDRYLDLNDMSDQQLISTLLDYKTILAMDMSGFMAAVDKLSKLKDIPIFDERQDRDGDRKKSIISHLVVHAQRMVQEYGFDAREAGEAMEKLLDSFVVSNEKYRFKINYANPLDIGTWFWIFVGNPMRGLTVDGKYEPVSIPEFIPYLNAFDKLNEDRTVNAYFDLLLKREPEGQKNDIEIENAMQVLSTNAMRIAKGESYERIVSEFKEQHDKYLKATKSIQRKVRPSRDGIARLPGLLMSLFVLSITSIAVIVAKGGGADIFIENPVLIAVAAVCLSVLTVPAFLYAAWRYLSTKRKAVTPGKAKTQAGTEKAELQAAPEEAETQAPAVLDAAAIKDVDKKMEKILDIGKGLIGSINDDLGLLDRFRDDDIVRKYRSLLKAPGSLDEKVKQIVLKDTGNFNINEILSATRRMNIDRVSLDDIIAVSSDKQFELIMGHLYKYGGFKDRQDTAKKRHSKRYSMEHAQKQAIFFMFERSGWSFENIVGGMKDEVKEGIAAKRKIDVKEIARHDLAAEKLSDMVRIMMDVVGDNESRALRVFLIKELNDLGIPDEDLASRVRDEVHGKDLNAILDRTERRVGERHKVHIAVEDLSFVDIILAARFSELYAIQGISETTSLHYKALNTDLLSIKWEFKWRDVLGRLGDFSVWGLFWGSIGAFLSAYPVFWGGLTPWDTGWIIAEGTALMFLGLWMNGKYMRAVFTSRDKQRKDRIALQLSIIERIDKAMREVEALLKELPGFVVTGIPTHSPKDLKENLVYRYPGYYKEEFGKAVTFYDLLNMVNAIKEENERVREALDKPNGQEIWTRYISEMNRIDKTRRVRTIQPLSPRSFFSRIIAVEAGDDEDIAGYIQRLYESFGNTYERERIELIVNSLDTNKYVNTGLLRDDILRFAEDASMHISPWSQFERFFNVLMQDVKSQFDEANALFGKPKQKTTIREQVEYLRDIKAKAIKVQRDMENDFKKLGHVLSRDGKDAERIQNEVKAASGIIQGIRSINAGNADEVDTLVHEAGWDEKAYYLPDSIKKFVDEEIRAKKESLDRGEDMALLRAEEIFELEKAMTEAASDVWDEKTQDIGWASGFKPIIARHFWPMVVGAVSYLAFTFSYGIIHWGERMQFEKWPIFNLVPQWREVSFSPLLPVVVFFIVAMSAFAAQFLYNLNLSIWSAFKFMSRSGKVFTVKQDLVDAIMLLDETVRDNISQKILDTLREKDPKKAQRLAGRETVDILETLSYKELFDFMIHKMYDAHGHEVTDPQTGSPLYEFEGYFYLFMANLPEQYKDKLLNSIVNPNVGDDKIGKRAIITRDELVRRAGKPEEDMTTLDIARALNYDELMLLKKLKGDAAPYPKVTLVVSTFGEEEVVEKVCKVITGSGYPGTDAIIAAEAKDFATNRVVGSAIADGRIPDTIIMSYTTTRPDNAPTVFSMLSYGLGIYRETPMLPQTKPYADNQANAWILVDDVFFKEKPYTFNLIDVEDRPQRRYLWEQTVGFMTIESTLDRLNARLREGKGISPRDLRKDIAEYERKAENEALSPSEKKEAAVNARLTRMLSDNIKRWNFDVNLDVIAGKKDVRGIIAHLPGIIWAGLMGYLAIFVSWNLFGGPVSAAYLITFSAQAWIFGAVLAACFAGWYIREHIISTERTGKDRYSTDVIRQFKDRNLPMVIQTVLQQKPYSGTANWQTTLNYMEWFYMKLGGFVAQRSALSILGIFYGGINSGVYIFPLIWPYITAAAPLLPAYAVLVPMVIAGIYAGGMVVGYTGFKAGFINYIQAIPLGGTGNNFHYSRFVDNSAHDGYNVTEDLDLGVRILVEFRRVMMLDGPETEVQEDSQPHLGPKRWWQVARWMIGHLVTGLMFFSCLLPLIFHPIRSFRIMAERSRGEPHRAWFITKMVLRNIISFDMIRMMGGPTRALSTAATIFMHLIVAPLSGLFTIAVYIAADMFILFKFVLPVLLGWVPGVGPLVMQMSGEINGIIGALFPYITTPEIGLYIILLSYGSQLVFGAIPIFLAWKRYPAIVEGQLQDLKDEKIELLRKGKDTPWAMDGIDRRTDDLSFGQVRLTQGARRIFYRILIAVGVISSVMAGLSLVTSFVVFPSLILNSNVFLWAAGAIALVETLDKYPVKLVKIFGDELGRKMYMVGYGLIRNFYNIIFGGHYMMTMLCVVKQIFFALDSYWAKTQHPALSTYVSELRFKRSTFRQELMIWKNWVTNLSFITITIVSVIASSIAYTVLINKFNEEDTAIRQNYWNEAPRVRAARYWLQRAEIDLARAKQQAERAYDWVLYIEREMRITLRQAGAWESGPDIRSTHEIYLEYLRENLTKYANPAWEQARKDVLEKEERLKELRARIAASGVKLVDGIADSSELSIRDGKDLDEFERMITEQLLADYEALAENLRLPGDIKVPGLWQYLMPDLIGQNITGINTPESVGELIRAARLRERTEDLRARAARKKLTGEPLTDEEEKAIKHIPETLKEEYESTGDALHKIFREEEELEDTIKSLESANILEFQGSYVPSAPLVVWALENDELRREMLDLVLNLNRACNESGLAIRDMTGKFKEEKLAPLMEKMKEINSIRPTTPAGQLDKEKRQDELIGKMEEAYRELGKDIRKQSELSLKKIDSAMEELKKFIKNNFGNEGRTLWRALRAYRDSMPKDDDTRELRKGFDGFFRAYPDENSVTDNAIAREMIKTLERIRKLRGQEPDLMIRKHLAIIAHNKATSLWVRSSVEDVLTKRFVAVLIDVHLEHFPENAGIIDKMWKDAFGEERRVYLDSQKARSGRPKAEIRGPAFVIDGHPVFFTGGNWRGQSVEIGFGRLFGSTNLLFSEDGVSARSAAISSFLRSTRDNNVSMLRVDMLGSGEIFGAGKDYASAFDERFREDMKSFLDLAEHYGIKVQFYLDWSLMGAEVDLRSDNREIIKGGRQDIVTGESFLKDFISPFLEEFGSHNALIGIGLSEPEWYVEGGASIDASRPEGLHKPETLVPADKLRRFLSRLRAVRDEKAPKVYITVGSNYDKMIEGSYDDVDYCSIHYYPHEGITNDEIRADLEAAAAKLPDGKPWILGEFPAWLKKERLYEIVAELGGSGFLVWSYDPGQDDRTFKTSSEMFSSMREFNEYRVDFLKKKLAGLEDIIKNNGLRGPEIKQAKEQAEYMAERGDPGAEAAIENLKRIIEEAVKVSARISAEERAIAETAPVPPLSKRLEMAFLNSQYLLGHRSRRELLGKAVNDPGFFGGFAARRMDIPEFAEKFNSHPGLPFMLLSGMIMSIGWPFRKREAREGFAPGSHVKDMPDEGSIIIGLAAVPRGIIEELERSFGGVEFLILDSARSREENLEILRKAAGMKGKIDLGLIDGSMIPGSTSIPAILKDCKEAVGKTLDGIEETRFMRFIKRDAVIATEDMDVDELAAEMTELTRQFRVMRSRNYSGLSLYQFKLNRIHKAVRMESGNAVEFASDIQKLRTGKYMSLRVTNASELGWAINEHRYARSLFRGEYPVKLHLRFSSEFQDRLKGSGRDIDWLLGRIGENARELSAEGIMISVNDTDVLDDIAKDIGETFNVEGLEPKNIAVGDMRAMRMKGAGLEGMLFVNMPEGIISQQYQMIVRILANDNRPPSVLPGNIKELVTAFNAALPGIICFTMKAIVPVDIEELRRTIKGYEKALMSV